MDTRRWVTETSSIEETVALGALLGRHLISGDVIALSGELGAGKTAFAQGIARGMDIRAPVTSPTFTLINRYQAPDGRVLQHVDCYRLGNPSLEMWDAGLTDLFTGDDIVVIEWADRIPDLLPFECLGIDFTYLDDTWRRLCFRGQSERQIYLIDIVARPPRGDLRQRIVVTG
jgi:tRNA threonylcarbamoyladenosine biosynthesis protein TsaE